MVGDSGEEDVSPKPRWVSRNMRALPMLGRGRGDAERGGGGVGESGGVPPGERTDLLRSREIADEVCDVVGDDGDGCGKLAATHLAGYGAKGWAVEVVHVRVRQEHRVDGREIADEQTGAALAAQDDEASGEDWVDEQGTAGDLDEERGVSDEGDGGVVGGYGGRGLGFAEERLLMALADEAVKLTEFADGERNCARHRSLDIDAGARERARKDPCTSG